MVHALFKDGYPTATVHGRLYQYDFGQRLQIEGLRLPKAVEVHFALQEQGGVSETRIGMSHDGVTEVTIPDAALVNGDTTQRYSIYAFVYVTDAASGKTIRKIELPVTLRPKPEPFDTPEDAELFREAIDAVNDSADRAESAEASAEAWAHGHEAFPDRDEDNARFYAQQARDALQEIPGEVEDAKKDIDAYVTRKEQELKGATGNVYFAAFKVVDGRLKMYSDPAVDKVRFVRKGSRLGYRLAF